MSSELAHLWLVVLTHDIDSQPYLRFLTPQKVWLTFTHVENSAVDYTHDGRGHGGGRGGFTMRRR